MVDSKENKKEEPLWKRLTWTGGVIMIAGTLGAISAGVVPIVAVATAVGMTIGIGILASPLIAIELIAKHKESSAAEVSLAQPQAHKPSKLEGLSKKLGRKFKHAHDEGLTAKTAPTLDVRTIVRGPAQTPEP
jgi:hypothetical protein